MGRKNNRAGNHEPLDLTAARSPQQDDLPVPRTMAEQRSRQVYRQRLEQERVARQRSARIDGGIDWSVCLVPGCGGDLVMYGRLEYADPTKRDHTQRLPLCLDHLLVAFNQGATPSHANLPLMVEGYTRFLVLQDEKRKQRAASEKRARLASIDGHIYFLRLNGLVKVGWSRDVHTRLRSYGPDVRVLCIYPGTRDDETNLHRQLRPARAVGREWYEDGPIVGDFVKAAVAEHGEPVTYDGWTRPKTMDARPKGWAS